jgi:hypothetical protein
MVLQVIGIGSWTQAFATHGDGDGFLPVDTIFVEELSLDFRLEVARPAGIFYSTVPLNFLILVGMILHFYKTSKISLKITCLYTISMVISMGKAVIFGYLAIAVFTLVIGNKQQKIGIILSFLMTGFAFAIYSFIFPGLFDINFSSITILSSIFTRLSEVVNVLSPGSIFLESFIVFENLSSFRSLGLEDGENFSGLAALISNFHTIGIGAILFSILNMYAIFKVKSTDPDNSRIASLVMICLPGFVFMFSFFNMQLFWFFIGLGMLPIIKIWKLDFYGGGRNH